MKVNIFDILWEGDNAVSSDTVTMMLDAKSRAWSAADIDKAVEDHLLKHFGKLTNGFEWNVEE